MAAPSLETLSPEIQAQIMRNINSLPALLATVRASPRLYQVFRTRREYLLTQIAFNRFHPQIIGDVWALAKVLEVPKPITDHLVIHRFLNERKHDDDCLKPSIALETTIPLCKIGETIAWFTEEYRSNALDLLAFVGTGMDLQQDFQILHSELSATELGRLQRAFCRFETYCCLIGQPNVANSYYYGYRYLSALLPDECEEIACIRDHLSRRLIGVFEGVEQDGMDSDSIRDLGRQHEPGDWFSEDLKHRHREYMEYAMSRGLKFLRTLFESHGLKRAEIVISISGRKTTFITYALNDRNRGASFQNPGYDEGKYDGEDVFEGDEVDNLSQGLLWANKNKVPADYFRPPLKGLRDWGYVFWDRSRLEASGVLDINPEDVAIYSFNDNLDSRMSVQGRREPCPWKLTLEGWSHQDPLVFEARYDTRRRSSLDTSCAIGNGEYF
ncbi:MAG: hypothetical protein Q9169_005672 [Polycauliona sp. 2 TL-2023]